MEVDICEKQTKFAYCKKWVENKVIDKCGTYVVEKSEG